MGRLQGKGTHFHTLSVGILKMVSPLCRAAWQYLSKGRDGDIIDSVVPFMRIYPTVMHMCTQENICPRLLIEAVCSSKR